MNVMQDLGALAAMKTGASWVQMATIGVAEVASLCDALSVEPASFAELVAGGPLFPPWALQKLRKIIDNGVTQPEFPLRWAEKDVLLALSASGKARAALPILSEIADVWADAAEDFGSYDLSRLPRAATAVKIARVS